MYILELIAKLIKNKKEKKNYKISKKAEIYSEPVEETDYEGTCEHTFFPIDSTNEIFACSKCGIIAKKSELRRLGGNPFK